MKNTKNLSTAILILACVFTSRFSYGQDIAMNTVTTEIIADDCPQAESPEEAASSNTKVFKLNAKTDIPITVVSAGWSVYCMTKVYNKGNSTEAQILSLDKNNINSFDRGAVTPYNSSIDKMSYIPFYVSIPLPLMFFLTGKEMRSDFLELTFLYFETLSVTGLAGYSAVYFVDRYRPYAYDPSTSMGERMGQNAKNSFYAGHVEIISTSTFFMSEVYASYYPESKIKWLFFGGAVASTAWMGYMRLQAGEHFPSDVIIGGVAGALSGILVPYFHKNKILSNTKVSLSPYSTGTANGLTMIYKINR